MLFYFHSLMSEQNKKEAHKLKK